MGLEVGGRGGAEEEEKEEEEEEKISHMCESIGHRPLRGRCPKSKLFTDANLSMTKKKIFTPIYCAKTESDMF